MSIKCLIDISGRELAGSAPGSPGDVLAADEPGRMGFLTLAIISTDGEVVNTPGQPQDVVLLVDIANVVGSRPDGWWRDRAAAATRLLDGLAPLRGAEVTLPAGLGTVRITEVRAVVEGAAKRAEGPEAVSVLRAERDGDSEISEQASRLTASGKTPLVVTADRGLRRRLPERALTVGPGWLNRLLGR